MSRCAITTLLLLTMMLPSLAAQPKEPSPGEQQIAAYLNAQTDLLSKNVLAGATSWQDWQSRRDDLHAKYLHMLGLYPLPEKTPLKATITGSKVHGNVVVDNLHFQSKPGLYVTANLYRPKDNKQPLPTILYLCGHSGRGRDGNKSAFQDHGLWFANNGYNCLVLDTLQLGEIAAIHHGTYGLRGGPGAAPTRFWWHTRGYTPAGVECWNGVRALDYLVSRPDVDAQRLGVTGISGGGAATFWIAAADERVRCVVPVSGMSDLEFYVKEKGVNGHCDCMFLYNTYRFEWTTIAALIAPRPMLFANSDMDPIFPMTGNRRIIARLRTLYKMAGKPELVDEYVSKGGHDYRPDLRIAIYQFFNKHLQPGAKPVTDTQYPLLPAKELRVFPTDTDIPKDQKNTTIDESFVPRGQVVLPGKNEYATWRQLLLGQLRGVSFFTLPEVVPSAQVEPGGTPKLQWLVTEAPLKVALALVRPPAGGISTKGGTLIIAENEADLQGIPAWAKEHIGDVGAGVVYVLAPRGVGPRAWDTKSPPNTIARAHVLLGLTVDQGRVHDIAAVAGLLRAQDDNTKDGVWKVVGRGSTGLLGVYAALLSKSIGEVVVIDPPTTHDKGPYFLNVQRVLEVPEALGLLAPLRLTLVGARDTAFDRTAAMYELAGASKQLLRK